jgi:voltage-gated potassium channel Kch
MISGLFIAFGILGICLVIHIAGMVFIGDRLVRRREEIERNAGPLCASILLIVVFSFVILLHLTETCIWAALYAWLGLFENYETALYFSLKTYSTVGYGDVLLPHDWRIVGTVEALSGVLLCGLSAAFLFAIVNTLFRFRVAQFSKLSPKIRRMSQVEGSSDALSYD